MKTKLLVFTMFVIGFTSLSQNTYVPDDVFEQLLIDWGYDSPPLDDYVPTANINAVTFLEIQFYNIADLTGIEGFSALEILRCNYLKLTSLDLSQNTALTWLDCIDNQLTSLDLSQNTLLTTLDCQLNQLTSLDLSQNVLLTNLNCSSNNITSLNVSQNTALTSLSCSFNQLTSLNFSQNSELTFLHCYNNQLTSLDLSQNTELTNLLSENNDLTSLNIKNGNNTIINTFSTIGNPNLTCINVDNANYSTTNWTNIDTQTSFSEDCASFLGVDDEVLAEGLKLYPNPVSDILSVESKLALKKIEIYSILGQKVKEINSDFNSISMNHLSRGIFLIKIYSEKGIAVRKLIKQ